LKHEGIHKRISGEGAAELRLCYIQNGHYGGVEIGNPDGPLGSTFGPKLQAYRGVLVDGVFREQIGGLLRKGIRNHERFLAQFDATETPPRPRSSSNDDNAFADGDDNIVERGAYAFPTFGGVASGCAWFPAAGAAPGSAVLFTTYHPLLIESHYSVLLCLLMLGDFTALLRAFVAATVVDGLECYPIFLPPRTMAQVEFVETLERLAGGWRIGTQPHSRARARARRGNNNTPNGKLAIEAPPERTSSPLAPSSPSSLAPCQSASPPSAWDIVRPAFAIDVFICLTFCSGSGTPHTVALSRTCASWQYRPWRVTRLRAYRPRTHRRAPAGTRRTECAREAEALVSDLVCLSSACGDGVGNLGKGKAKPLPINIPLHGPYLDSMPGPPFSCGMASTLEEWKM